MKEPAFLFSTIFYRRRRLMQEIESLLPETR